MFADINLDFRCKSDFHTVRLGHLREVPMGATIHVAHAHDMASCRETLEDQSSGCRTRGKGERIFRMFDGCDGLLEIVAVGIGGARVLVGAYWLSDGGLREGGREGDGFDDGAGGGIVR